MGYGVLALAPLGDQYITVGILAGLYSAIFIPLTILLLGDRHPLMYAPRSVVTFLLASVIAGNLAQTQGPRTLVLVFLITFLAGIFQALFGILRLGNLIRYIPAPVMAGFQNAVAVLIFLSQLAPIIGAIPAALPTPSYFTGFVSVLAPGQLRQFLPTVALAAATLALLASLDALLCAKTAES